eukprot:13935479-Alexandrium_andersonii.AAC.1
MGTPFSVWGSTAPRSEQRPLGDLRSEWPNPHCEGCLSRPPLSNCARVPEAPPLRQRSKQRGERTAALSFSCNVSGWLGSVSAAHERGYLR